ncbi:TPA: hypothetical protein G9F11_002849 [Salmonella enterica]|uniref:Uncharacterized protein n=1 Tax=Salmonella enterica TaxID=28901 RepID=A0A750HN33_SALER|nr:hypothetical protein [Salmonella enterica]EEU4804682.1 hypothetical protein [Salmonella enterica]EEU4868184.1 hypothetical protein [Salmonella enterica]EEU4895578.1 hypothetical protein [Salmonella enterica]HAF6260226.1 hypothetical protein [Salmonella enterica]
MENYQGDFQTVLTQYLEHKRSLILEAYIQSLHIYGAGDYSQAKLSFSFLLHEIQSVISSGYFPHFHGAANQLRMLQDYISECDSKILQQRGNHHANG